MADQADNTAVIASDADAVQVEVACGTRARQVVLALVLPKGTTAREAVLASKIGDDFPELNVGQLELAVYGTRIAADTPVKSGDRVEVSRPLTIDPREARRRRVARQRSER